MSQKAARTLGGHSGHVVARAQGSPLSARGPSAGICSAEAPLHLARAPESAPALRPSCSPCACAPGAHPHARCLSAPWSGLPHPRHIPGVSSPPLRAAATGLAHPRGGARRRDVRAENEHGASAPSQRLPEAHVLDWRGRRRLGDAVSGSAGAQPGGRAGGGQRLSPGETAALTALPATPGVDPGLPLVFPGVLAKPPGVPINFLGDYSVCLFFFLFSSPCVPFSRMAEAELHKERLQAIAVSPLSFYFLALLSGMERHPSVSGHPHSSTVAAGHVFGG